MGVTDTAETDVSPERTALDAELACFDDAFKRHGEGVSEEQSHGGDECEECVDGKLHLDQMRLFFSQCEKDIRSSTWQITSQGLVDSLDN